MEELNVFKNEMFGEVRVVSHEGDPWFVARDVCECLGIGNVGDVIAALDDDEKGIDSIDTLGILRC